jgi:hypothetical protein
MTSNPTEIIEYHPQDYTPPAWLDEHSQQLRTAVLHSFSWADILPIGLAIRSREFSWDDYERTAHFLLTLENASQWTIGDAYNAGLIRFRGKRDPTQAFTARKVKIKTIQNYAWTCRKYTLSQRLYPPSFSHHALVAKLPPERRVYWLLRCISEDLSCEELDVMSAAERGLTEDDLSQFSLLIRRYNAILRSWQSLPPGEVKAGIKRGLKLIEEALNHDDR